MSNLEIEWTKVDEAPGLATYSLLPIVQSCANWQGMMPPSELMTLRMLMTHMRVAPPKRTRRRTLRSSSGQRLDMRATIDRDVRHTWRPLARQYAAGGLQDFAAYSASSSLL